MAKPRINYRNFRSAGHTAAKYTGQAAEKVATGFAGWIVTNPTGSCIPPLPST